MKEGGRGGDGGRGGEGGRKGRGWREVGRGSGGGREGRADSHTYSNILQWYRAVFKYQSRHVLRNNLSRCLPMEAQYDMCDDADIRAKRGEFIGSVNRLNAQFRVVAADVLYCLVWVSDVAPQYNFSQRDEY